MARWYNKLTSFGVLNCFVSLICVFRHELWDCLYQTLWVLGRDIITSFLYC